MKLLPVLLLSALAIGCGYGSNYNSMTGGGAAPHISAISPTSQTAGTAFTLTVTGTGLNNGATVYFGMTAVAGTSGGYNSGNVMASITSAMDTNPGTVSVYVHTSAGSSNSLTFTVN
jgi:hypothetical protein